MTLSRIALSLVFLISTLVSAQAQTLEQRALTLVLNGGTPAQETVRDFRFFETESARELTKLTVERMATSQGDPFMFNLIWTTVGGIGRSSLSNGDKDQLFDQIFAAIRERDVDELNLIVDVIEFRLGRLGIPDLDLGALPREEQMQWVQKLETAAFLSEVFQTAQPNYDASVDFWNYQKALREKLAAWRPDGFDAPITTLFDPFSRSGFGYRVGGYGPVLSPPADGTPFVPGPLGPENLVLRATLINGTNISAPGTNPSRALARARLAYLAGILATNKVVLPTTPLGAKGGPGPNMSWRIDTYADSGRCNSKSSGFTTEGIDNYSFGYNCNYDGGDSTSSETVGAIAVGTERFGAAEGDRSYWALAASFARGGFADRGDENQTATLNYKVHGRITLPKCNDPGNCAPIVEVHAAIPVRHYPGFDQNPPPQARHTLIVDGSALPVGETAIVDLSTKSAEIEVILERSFIHVGACCFPGRGQSRASLVVSQVGAAQLGLLGVGNDDVFAGLPNETGPMSPGLPFGPRDLNRDQTENLVDLLRAASGFKYLPDLLSANVATLETRKSAFLGRKASGGFLDELSTILTALYLIHDFQAHRPDDVPPHVTTLLRLLQAKLSNTARLEFEPAMDEAIRTRQQQLQLLGSSLFSQTLTEARSLLIANSIEREKLVVLLREIAPLLNDPNLEPRSAGELRDEINTFEANSANNTLALLTRLDGFTSEMAAVRSRLESEVEMLIKIQAQF